MSIRTTPWPAGVPCFADLQSPDVAAASAFYTSVLGWTLDAPSEQFGGYVVANVRGHPVAGIGPQMEHAPVSWTLYLASDDAEATQAAIAEHGGTVIVPVSDVGDLGRMLIATDPTGAAFGVWQNKEFNGAQLVNEPGGITWEDLRSTDPDAARGFYRGVFGYRTEAMEMAGPDYTTFHRDGEEGPLGGIGGMFGAPEGTPSHWLVYFAVADAGAAAAAATAGGGSVVAEPFDTAYGPMAALQDPAGAVFWVVETDGSQSPDRSG